MRVIYISIIVTMLKCAAVQAGVLEFPLPNIQGGFATYQDSVLYTGDTLEVSAVRLVISAVIDDLGSQICPSAPPLPADVCNLGFHYWGTVWKNQESNITYGPKEYYEYTQTGDYENSFEWRGGKWGFTELVDGDVIRVGFGIFEEMLCCVPPVETYDPVVSVTAVTLLIEVPDLVPVEPATWGRIKSLFDRTCLQRF